MNNEKITAGRKKLPSLFSEILETHDKTFHSGHMMDLIFYISLVSELNGDTLIVDCAELIAHHNIRPPAPVMKEVIALPRFGFVFDELTLRDGYVGNGMIKDIVAMKLSHTNTDIIHALKAFADECGFDNPQKFRKLDVGVSSGDISDILNQDRFNIVSDADKQFIIALHSEMQANGYDFGGDITWGACWGKYQVIWSKVGVKSKQVAARIYIRDDQIVLRLFFTKIDKHREYIENAEDYIKQAFMKGYGDCGHCKSECNGRKVYVIDGETVEKCSGWVYEFYNPTIDKLSGYVNLFKEFYDKKKV